MSFKELSLTWGMLLAAAALNVLGLYAIKARLAVLGSIPVTALPATIEYVVTFLRSPAALLGVVCIFAAPLPHAVALSRMPLALAYPASVGLTALLLLPLSVLVLGEPLTGSRIAGIVLLTASLAFLYR